MRFGELLGFVLGDELFRVRPFFVSILPTYVEPIPLLLVVACSGPSLVDRGIYPNTHLLDLDLATETDLQKVTDRALES